MTNKYQRTLRACFIGYIVQAAINNFAPLLFLTFQASYHISLSKITALVTVNFGVQLMVDLLSAGLIDRIGYRPAALTAHALSATGMLMLMTLPDLLPDPYVGLLTAVAVYAAGGGMLEVVISPIVEACPTDNKEKAMSMLHSFYCWGQVGIVLVSTLFFRLFGIGRWKLIAVVWALIPIANFFVFTKVPLVSLTPHGEKSLSIRQLAGKRIFWIMMLLMLCAGSCEQAVSQWASTYAERGLGVNKTLGDLAGPMMFAVMMGLERTFYGRHGEKFDLNRSMLCSGGLCLISYLLISLSPFPVVGLLGCGLCGLSVGILWPGTFSTASASIRNGGTPMFALLALAGDLGCSTGPTFVGLVSSRFGDNLKIGILAAMIFPILLIAGTLRANRLKPAPAANPALPAAGGRRP